MATRRVAAAERLLATEPTLDELVDIAARYGYAVACERAQVWLDAFSAFMDRSQARRVRYRESQGMGELDALRAACESLERDYPDLEDAHRRVWEEMVEGLARSVCDRGEARDIVAAYEARRVRATRRRPDGRTWVVLKQLGGLAGTLFAIGVRDRLQSPPARLMPVRRGPAAICRIPVRARPRSRQSHRRCRRARAPTGSGDDGPPGPDGDADPVAVLGGAA